ncbi:adenine phosphoribosyltransferase [Nannochloropsis gaditana CCMP526]|uniref:adenine phosphoribosyltransferase n=1 Tax=Nannochloropsis gaditana TaxID=72520 RepID=W7TK76_9STRA|nr:adenine phosphoribosyltransferase [Nannochloropsis gaditana CCMP526]EKU22186.1 adenine phosphoribosyltransferase [Nannochloropsis gaditana CCMP526]EWM23913.1 adenine phosphoribosyltransferase [Nannochloropsis gaditana]|eukprot:XP_005854175.1 adenine phosphoribosyltransferase [Nannochloropsis gaditana CCMP526]
MAGVNPATSQDYEEDKRKIAAVIPYYAFKGIDRFYDISGLLLSPALLRRTIEILVERYKGMAIDKIGGFDARGFLLGTPLALELDIPFFMLRKQSKLPNSVTGDSYTKEYEGDDGKGGDALCISRTAIIPGDKVLLVDDLIATGGTLLAGLDLVHARQGVVVEAACMIELGFLEGGKKVRERNPNVTVWSLLSEDHLQTRGLPPGTGGNSAAGSACASDGKC